jgi:methylamine---glutamate N-methyltransferase subunit A
LCGIAGIIYANPTQFQQLGSDLLTLIQPLESRGPDSCGVGLYGDRLSSQVNSQVKILIRGDADTNWHELKRWIEQVAPGSSYKLIADVQQVTLDLTHSDGLSLKELQRQLQSRFPQQHWVSAGQALEVYKGVESVESLAAQYDLKHFSGTHGIGHTRMATESVVDLDHCHPFTSSCDLAIVHNGQISNYYKLRFQLERAGAIFETDNDSEAIAHYIDYQLLQGKTLEAALHRLLEEIDGTYTFLVATPTQVGLVRDKYAAKPAVIYESGGMVAIASEYHALLRLPNFDPTASIREPDAGEVNVWSVVSAPQMQAALSTY